MSKKILRYQLVALFFLTLLNLVYFTYRDALPDNTLEIAYNNSSINFVTYFGSSFLAYVGFYSGLWVLGGCVLFTVLYSLVLQKKKISADWSVAILCAGSFMCLAQIFYPTAIGDGLYLLLRTYSSDLILGLMALTQVLGLYYLVAPQSFKKRAAALQKNVIKLWNWVLKSVARPEDFKQSINELWVNTKTAIISRINAWKKEQPVIPAATMPAAVRRMPVAAQMPIPTLLPQTEEIVAQQYEGKVEDEETEDENEDSEFYADDTAVDEEIEVEAETTEDEEWEDDTLEAKPRKRTAPVFFDSSELIDCISGHQTVNNSNPDEGYFQQISAAIEDKLAEFNIQAKVINVLKGPVVDTYELTLGAGVKVAGVTNRTDDLSLALWGAPIRMVYPMKGKTTIGIEVPRNPREVIYLDDVLRSQSFIQSTQRLPIAMGKDAYGESTVMDLATMPHMLVAGSTGAGKSVFINTLLVSLIIKLSPQKLKLILIDPKQLELALYQELPHLILPVVTDPSTASCALLWAVEEMERRYSIMKELGVKNIEGYNRKIVDGDPIIQAKVKRFFEDSDTEDFELPYLVIIVDEFADLVLSKAGKDIETNISRLAAKARASGIHIILATQRPSTDVLTGVIKANFPTRVSFRVTSNIDSRVVLDVQGAEKLLGKGDMLFKLGVDLIRLHSAYVDEEEIEILVKKLSSLPVQFSQAAIEFIENNKTNENGSHVTFDGADSQPDDDLFGEAVKVVVEMRMASASMLQRRLRVGYNRAANLIEEMEKKGIVGPQQGSKPRQVLMGPSDGPTS